jgi:alkanesulfonate monooxygenase SsuD/methylene tetrahydromethanopterin reductase-like flavin-dependent oxidoreductase (luciferase family)
MTADHRENTKMKFGLFGGAQAVPGEVVTEAALGYHEYGDYIRLAEKLGYSSAWLVEHHFTGFSQLSATLNYISYLSGITSKIRLGSAVVVIPWHNPILLAEQIATIDQLSKGRYDFGLGRGYRGNEFHGFGMDMADAQEIFEESVMLLKRSFTETERWSYKSERWTFNDIIVEPPVVQKPYPPMSPFEAIGDKIRMYQDELDKLGKAYDPDRVAVTRGMMVANNDNQRSDAHILRGKFISQVQVLSKDKTEGPKAFSPVGNSGDTDAISENGAVLGSSEEMCERVGRLRDEGVQTILLHDLSGSSEALQQFAEEVMPKFADSDASAQAAE